MSKKIDIKRTLGRVMPPLSVDAVEEMTRLIHDKKPAENQPSDSVEKSISADKTTPQKTTPHKVKESPAANYEKTTVENEKSKRGRKPKFIIEEERLLRVSVDLPESVFIQLKVCVIQQKTDMKTFIRKMIEKEMEKQNK